MIEPKSVGPAAISIASSDQRLRVEFSWQSDRFVHRIWLDDNEVGHSMDGDGDSDWPASPPIQQLSLEAIGPGKVVLGVGGAGQGHWSISVEAYGEDGLKFDLACRCRGTAESLGSEYELAGTVRLNVTDGEFQKTKSGSRVCPTMIAQTVPGSANDRQTHRWAYFLQPARDLS